LYFRTDKGLPLIKQGTCRSNTIRNQNRQLNTSPMQGQSFLFCLNYHALFQEQFNLALQKGQCLHSTYHTFHSKLIASLAMSSI